MLANRSGLTPAYASPFPMPPRNTPRCKPAASEVGELLRWDGVPPMFSFDDPDGNRYYIVEEMS